MRTSGKAVGLEVGTLVVGAGDETGDVHASHGAQQTKMSPKAIRLNNLSELRWKLQFPSDR